VVEAPKDRANKNRAVTPEQDVRGLPKINEQTHEPNPDRVAAGACHGRGFSGARRGPDGRTHPRRPDARRRFESRLGVRAARRRLQRLRLIILEPLVAFRKNWQRDFNRQSAQRRITDADMERIMDGMKELFLEVFTEELEKSGYPVVEEPGENVLIIRPAIIDLDVAAPDIPGSARTRSYVTSAGAARLYAEFFDSVTGQILARVVDYKRAPDWGSFQWATSASNRAEARRVIGSWADMLVTRLDEIHDR
jgi:Protein of unknown function (DUF3313)